MWRWLAAVLLLVVAALALAEWAQWPFLRHPLGQVASNALGRQVTLRASSVFASWGASGCAAACCTSRSRRIVAKGPRSRSWNWPA